MPLLLRLLPAASLLALALSCQQKPAETTAPPLPAAPAPPAAPVAAAPTVAQRSSSIISGYWVSAEYLDEVARTRSPEAAFDHTPPGPAELVIMPFADKQDSVEVGLSYGLHEGGNLTLLLPHRPTANVLPIRYQAGDEVGTTSELAYRITATDTTLFHVTRQNKTHKVTSTIAYRRTGMTSKESDLEEGVKRGINALLITGRYKGIDSLNQPIQAQFFTNGIVKGLPFTEYYIQTDFAGPSPGNTIVFNLHTKQQQELAASFGRDTLKLYTIHSSTGVAAGEVDPNNIFSRGRLRYQLVRVKQP